MRHAERRLSFRRASMLMVGVLCALIVSFAQVAHARADCVVIGENTDRVSQFAQANGHGFYQPDPDLPPDQWEQANSDWINARIDAGDTIYDIGPDPNNPYYPQITSDYYQIEVDAIDERNYSNVITYNPYEVDAYLNGDPDYINSDGTFCPGGCGSWNSSPGGDGIAARAMG